MAFSLNPKWVSGEGGTCEVVSHFYEADSMSFKKGELVYLSSGAVTNCADDAVVIAGQALADATNVTSGNIIIPIRVIKPGDVWMIRCYDTSDAAEITCDNLTIGSAYGLEVTSNVWRLDNDETTADAVTPIRLHYDVNGDADEWIYVRFMPAVCQMFDGA